MPNAVQLASDAAKSEFLEEAVTFLDVPRADIVARIAPIAVPPKKT